MIIETITSINISNEREEIPPNDLEVELLVEPSLEPLNKPISELLNNY